MASSPKRSRSRRNEPAKRSDKPSPAVVSAASTATGFGLVLFLIFLSLGLCTLAALASYDNTQKFFFSETYLRNFASSGSLAGENLCGQLGATFSVLSLHFFGVGAFLLPLYGLLIASYAVRSRASFSLYWKCMLMFALLCAGTLLLTFVPVGISGSNSSLAENPSSFMPKGPGGVLGEFLRSDVFEPVLGIIGTACVAIGFSVFCLLSLLVAPPGRIFAWCVNGVASTFSRWKAESAARKEARRRLIEARRQNAREISGEIRDARTDANSTIPMRVGGRTAILPEPKRRDSASREDDFSDVSVHPNAVPDYVPEALNPIETDFAFPAEVSSDDELSAEESEPENKETGPEKIIGTLTPFPHKEIPYDVPEALPQRSVSGTEKTPQPVEPASIEDILGETKISPEHQPVPAEEVIEEREVQIIEDEGLERADETEVASRGEYVFPPLSLLKAPPEEKISEATSEEFKERGLQIVDALSKFKISSELTTVQVGPTITRYEITPQDDVRVEKILGLQNNIAMKIKAQSARLALVPEHGTVGIEVPNKTPKPVFIREILESKTWHENRMEIPVILGKDVTGKPVIMDLARMPHGLIAGSTGSGKSVCINGIVTSILYSASPEDVRLVMVDPKVVELEVYNRVPHMLIPVISDAKKVPGAIKWLINEMERRYDLLRRAGVRNIVGFNAKLIKDREEAAAAREAAAALEKELSASERAAISEKAEISIPRDEGVLDELAAKKKMAYIVCIVDEFSDLMQVAGAEIESGIARLAAKARAAGIHLILATQRPDAKTVTGLIKANLPSRIAFKVTSAVNSKIILDEIGAESLIGKGDMLYLPPGTSILNRAQGSFVSEEEIAHIVDFLHENNGAPHYAQEVQDAIDRAAEEAEEEKNGGKNTDADDFDLNDDEVLMEKAWEVIRTTQRASTSSLQIKLRIGYGKATRIMNMLEDRGYIGPPQSGSKTRDILRND